MGFILLNAQKEKIKKDQGRLLDLLIDQKISEDEYQQKKAEYIFQEKKISEQLSSYNRAGDKIYQKIEQLGKLLKSPYLSYKTAFLENKRRLVQSMVENFVLYPEKLALAWKIPFDLVAKRTKFESGRVARDRWKTFMGLVREVYDVFQRRPFLVVPQVEIHPEF